MNLIKFRPFAYAISLILVAASVILLIAFGLKLGIDFTGGSILEVAFTAERPQVSVIQEKVSGLGFGNVLVQPTGEKGVILRMRDLSEEEHQRLITQLSPLGSLRELRFDSIGPTIGKELRDRAVWATLSVLTMIILYVAWAFRHVSRPVSSWMYGIFAVVALFHDILIPAGLFAFLGKYYGVEVDTLFVTAILTVLGFSVHDTIVVFDRIRENLKNQIKGEGFEEIVGQSLNETLTRSINTSLTVLIVLLALYFLGSESTKYFSLTLIVGIIAGTYSSIFVASPLLVTWHNWRKT